MSNAAEFGSTSRNGHGVNGPPRERNQAARQHQRYHRQVEGPGGCSSWRLCLPMSMAAWNSAGLFGTLTSDVRKINAKREYATGIFDRNMVVGICETHGMDADLEPMKVQYSAHTHFGTFCETDGDLASSRMGGCTLSVRSDLLRRFPSIFQSSLSVGVVWRL